jgi:hypothetical protein
MKKSLFKTLFLAAVGMTVCLGANAQKLGADAVAATNADPSLQVGDDFYYGEIFDYTILSVESGSGEVTYTVAVKGLLDGYPAEEVADLVIPAGDSFTKDGTAYTFTVVGITAFAGYEEVQSLTIPASVESVAGVANLAGLTKIFVEGEEPAAAAADAFTADIYNNVLLQTDNGTLMGVYNGEVSKAWTKFAKITDGEAILGDGNDDGVIEPADLSYLLTAIKVESEEAKYDMDGNGSVEPADLSFLLTKIKIQP